MSAVKFCFSPTGNGHYTDNGYATSELDTTKNIDVKRKKPKMNQYNYKPYYRRNLPHIQPPGATFFITFNLTGSIPKHILQQYITEKRKLEAAEQITFKEKQDIPEKKRE